MNPEVQLVSRSPNCMKCALSDTANGKNRCRTADGPTHPDVLVVTKTPLSKKMRAELEGYLEAAQIDPARCAFTAAVKCLTFEQDLAKDSVKQCREYLETEVSFMNPSYILAMGNEALQSATGHSGIMKYRGKFVDFKGGHTPVMPTIALGAVSRNPSQRASLQADLNMLANDMHGIVLEDNEPPDEDYHVVGTKQQLKDALAAIRSADAVAFDLETTGFDEHAPDAAIVSACTTVLHGSELTVYAFPLWHRASVWQSRWKTVVGHLRNAIMDCPRRIAHNAKFDCRWMAEFTLGVEITFDTMLAAHLLDENRARGLKPLAQLLLGAPAWDIKIKGGKNAIPWYLQHTLKDILRYNALDTWHTMRLYRRFRQELLEQPRLARLMTSLMAPGSNAFVDVERSGVYVFRDKLTTNRQTTLETLADFDRQLMDWVPEDTPYPVNFNPSKFLQWWLYDHLGLPILERGKSGPSTKEEVLSHLAEHHPSIPILLQRKVWNKYETSFFRPYTEQITPDSRIHTTFKLSGTVTGRLSSGKADLEKVTGAKQVRGVNLQQVPRNPLVRGIFGAPPGSTFVEFDYSQIELRVAAFLADEPTMKHLYQTGQDIHMTMAMRMTGKPKSQVAKEERKKAKAVNFGFLYGMGWRKFIETAWNNYGLTVTEEEAQIFRKAFFDEFPRLIDWHARQRRLAHKYKRVESPIGRIRHLPDIDSEDRGVQNEAERQAINSPVQGFGSDLATLSMIRIVRALKKRNLSTRVIGTVHDAINFEVPDRELPTVLPLVKRLMETPPLERLFGVEMTVPIIADCKIGSAWGEAEEIDDVASYVASLG